MSNVLIGIIGVILFIGLALAGALFLGPRFQESTNNSRASAAVQAVSQIANAANMYQVQEGKVAPAIGTSSDTSTSDTLVGKGYLKSVPSNPTDASKTAVMDATTDKRVTMELGGNASSICDAIAKQTSGASSAPAKASATGTSGCYTDTGSKYVAFASI